MARWFYCIFLVTAAQLYIPESLVSAENQSITVVRTAESVKIDGVLSEQIWQRPGFTGISQADPDQGEPCTQKSEIWFAYDDGAIYFAAKYYDTNPDSIMARLVRRDFIWGDPSDGCVLYLDPYHDHRNGYFFYVSAAGTLADGIIENDVKQPNDITWDAVWDGASHLDPDGWTIEMKIPFSQLRFKEGASQVWGVDVERYISRRNETDMIAYTPRNDSRFVSRFPDLVGLEGMTPSARFEALPYVTARTERIGNDHRDPFRHRERYIPGAGLDLKAGLGSSLTLDGTINPDFCQVEVDPANVNLTDVETLYEEKRPFFIEGVGIFRFGQGGSNNIVSFNWNEPNIFYSRRIGRTPQRGISGSDPASHYFTDIPGITRILGAGKISGRLGSDWKIGALLALTNREHAEIDENGARSNIEIEPLTYYGVFRAQRDYHSGMQGLGVLSTYTRRVYDDEALRNFTNKDALVAAIDGFTFLDDEKTYVVSGWSAVSNVSGNQTRLTALQRNSGHYFQRPDVGYLGVDSTATSLTGYAGRVMLNKNRGQWIFNTAAGFINPKFEVNDLGSSVYSDVINLHFYTSYRWNTPTKYYQYTGLNAAAYANFDFGGNNTLQGYYFSSYLTLPSYYGANFSVTYYPASMNARLTRGGPLTRNPKSRQVNISMFTDLRDWWVLQAGGSIRTGDAAVINTAFASLELKATETLTLSVGPTLTEEVNRAQYMNSYPEASALETYGRQYLFARLDRYTLAADIRADWIISPKLSFQVYIQPYITTGQYSDFKTLVRPRSFSFASFQYSGNPDFNYISLQGNAVLRWEYLPGSVLYVVWTQSRLDDRYYGDFQFGNSMDRMLRVRPDNILMLKLSYWFGM
ncbi:MAG: hypothetical protein EHM64_09450 [Ignavibacteriae bacterium]|nr:MAG: hypothetical protein EHM64_09450 [Ignavibacteriota bacterium]